MAPTQPGPASVRRQPASHAAPTARTLQELIALLVTTKCISIAGVEAPVDVGKPIGCALLAHSAARRQLACQHAPCDSKRTLGHLTIRTRDTRSLRSSARAPAIWRLDERRHASCSAHPSEGYVQSCTWSKAYEADPLRNVLQGCDDAWWPCVYNTVGTKAEGPQRRRLPSGHRTTSPAPRHVQLARRANKPKDAFATGGLES